MVLSVGRLFNAAVGCVLVASPPDVLRDRGSEVAYRGICLIGILHPFQRLSDKSIR